MTASVSDQWRNQGNAVYVSAKTDLPPTVRESRLQNALNLFHRALDTATTDNEVASASKNIGVSSWKLASVGCMIGHTWYTIRYHFGTSLKNLCRSYEVGTGCGKPMTWCDNILASIRSCFEEIRQVEARDLNELKLSQALREFTEYIPAPDIKADCYIEIAQFHFNKGIVCLSVGDYKKCISELKECHYPLNEAARYGRDIQSVEAECRVIEADIVMQMSIAEAMKSRETGDQLLEDILLDEETLNIDMVWEIIDWYKDSILKGRDLDIKQEAMSLSRIGKVYDKVLKIKFKAREYLKKALELAQSITPFDVSNEVSARCPDTFEVILDQSCQRRHNERCSYTCKTGYKPTNISEQNVTCTTSSTWDKTLSTLCKKIKCPATIPHGNISTICSREYNTNCRYYKCDSGYLHPPDWPGLTCNFTGQWEWLQSSTRDFCINEMALCPSRVPGGRVYSSCDRTPLSTCGAICDYGCKDKLYSLSCSRNGEWIGGESACTCTTCPSYVHNGYISGATYGVGPCDFKVGSTCNVKCNEGCTEGVYTAYCDSTGHWSTADVVCDCSDVSTTRTITIVVSILGVIVFLAIVAGVCKSCHRWLSQQPTQRNMVSQSGFQQATLHISSPTNNSQRICENTTSNFRNAGPPLYTELSFTKLDETEPPPPYEDVLSQPKK